MNSNFTLNGLIHLGIEPTSAAFSGGLQLQWQLQWRQSELSESVYLVKIRILLDAPQWTNDGKPKSSVNVDLSKSTSLRCEVTAVPDAAFQWLKDGVKLSSGDNLAIMMHNGGSTLDLLDASDEDAGIYQCIAGNDRGYIFSSTKLNVLRK